VAGGTQHDGGSWNRRWRWLHRGERRSGDGLVDARKGQSCWAGGWGLIRRFEVKSNAFLNSNKFKPFLKIVIWDF
jgi:hypothetical protein